MELNHRPHAYQACALTGLSYRPLACFLKDLSDLSKLNSKQDSFFIYYVYPYFLSRYQLFLIFP